MLDDRNVSIRGLLFELRLFLLDVGKLDFLVFLRIGVNGGPGEGRIESRLPIGLVAIADQLQVEQRRNGRAAVVRNRVLHCDGIGTAAQGVTLYQLDAPHIGRREGQHQLVFPVLEVARTFHLHRRLVGWKLVRCSRSDQTALGDVLALFGAVEQDKVLALVCHVAMCQELGSYQGSTIAVECELEHVGADNHQLACRLRSACSRNRQRRRLLCHRGNSGGGGGAAS